MAAKVAASIEMPIVSHFVDNVETTKIRLDKIQMPEKIDDIMAVSMI